MGVKAGYKQTEAGIVPEDWDAPQLGSILKSTQLGGNYKNSERETNWPLIKMGNLGRGNISLTRLEFVDSSCRPDAKDRLCRDDILLNTRNTLELVGKVAAWRDELPEAYFNSNIMRMEFDSHSVSSKRLMNYVLNTPQSIKGLRAIAIGTTSVAAVYGRDLVKLAVALPPKSEQEGIAEALSDADALIESLEQLLAKKRQIKQGAMQELLTGKKRLPGFSAEWQTSRLGEIGHTFGGLTGKSKQDFGHGGARYITFMNIMSNVVIDCDAFDAVDVRPNESQNRAIKGDLFFNGSSETPEEVGMCSCLDADVQDVYLNSFCFGFRARIDGPVDRLYLAYYFRSNQGRALLKSLAQGATRSRRRLCSGSSSLFLGSKSRQRLPASSPTWTPNSPHSKPSSPRPANSSRA